MRNFSRKSNKVKSKKNKLRKTKSKTTKKNCNTKSNKQKKKTGGRYFNEGTYGIVYGEPRLLCTDETLDTPNIDNEVSKIFNDTRHAESEMNNVKSLSEYLSEDNLELLENYAVLPKKLCRLNTSKTMKEPYITGKWMSNSKGEYNEKIFNEKVFLPSSFKEYEDGNSLPTYRTILISDKGGDNLLKIFKKIDSTENFISCLRNLYNVGKGIQLLQNNGLIHGDIKSGNCIEHNNTFKIIDMADVRSIKETDDPKEMAKAFGYYTWPPTSVYTKFFDKIEPKFEQIEMKKEYLIENFEKQQDFNIKMFNTYLKESLHFPFEINNNNGFDDGEIARSDEIRNILISQKTFGITNVAIYNDRTLVYFLRSLLGFDENKKYDDFFINFNEVFSDKNFSSVEELKLDLFKRIDVYSFGILILECILGYLDFVKNDEIDENNRKIILELYEIAYQCCYQDKKVANIDDIIQKYETVLNIGNIESNISVTTSNNSNTPENIKNFFTKYKVKLGDIDEHNTLGAIDE
jgi:serine/threonine protein kinase